MVLIAIPAEKKAGESRVAAVPEIVAKYVSLGLDVQVQSKAGEASHFSDQDYIDAGAKITKTFKTTVQKADLVLCVQRPEKDDLKALPKNCLLIGMLDPYSAKDGKSSVLDLMAGAGLSALSMELLPRITRAQTMDVLSSQANIAGYQAVIEAAGHYGRALPMMMTAAGTVPAARAFIMGAGVAGLQAIATARRLGAVVSATDVRPASKEQVQSLGAKFIAVEDDEFKAAETSGGYAKAMSADYLKKQAELVKSHIVKQDLVITTALIPGRDAPRLIDKDMLKSMKEGSVVVDLATPRGGNVEGSVLDKVVQVEGVTLIGYGNMAGRISATSSLLYARNLYAFIVTLYQKDDNKLILDIEDELVSAMLLTHEGEKVHPDFSVSKPSQGEET